MKRRVKWVENIENNMRDVGHGGKVTHICNLVSRGREVMEEKND